MKKQTQQPLQKKMIIRNITKNIKQRNSKETKTVMPVQVLYT